MADETIAANKLGETIILQGEKDVVANYTEIKRIEGTDITAGDIVTDAGATASHDIDLVGGGEPATYVVLNYANMAEAKESYSLGVTIANGKLAKVLRKTGGRVMVQVLLNRADSVSAEVEIGQPIYASVTDAGKVSSVKPTTANIELMRFIGYSADNIAVSVTADKIIRVWM